MSLFSLRHSVKTFSAKCRSAKRVAKLGQTQSHLCYITRPRAARIVFRKRLSGSSDAVVAEQAEASALKRRGRVCERLIVALPLEASLDQREELVKAYAEHLTKGKAAFIAAIHDQHGNDTNNPHAHFVLFDAFECSGGRGRPKSVLGFARKNAIENAARDWAEIHNRMMLDWGYGKSSTISYLSYADRGIDKVPSIHEGPSSRSMSPEKRKSKKEWRHIDEGHTRSEANNIIREINKLIERTDDVNKSNNRLGRPDDLDRTRGKSCFSQKRECGGRARLPFEDTGNSRSNSWGEITGDAGEAVGTKCQHGKPDAQFDPKGGSTVGKSNTRNDQGHIPPFLGFVARIFRRRRVRRVFRELIMLRDTLKAKEIKRHASPLGSENKPLLRELPLVNKNLQKCIDCKKNESTT
nr:MobA/MobL family protein [uncultured Cohaesibacter sp.]